MCQYKTAGNYVGRYGAHVHPLGTFEGSFEGMAALLSSEGLNASRFFELVAPTQTTPHQPQMQQTNASAATTTDTAAATDTTQGSSNGTVAGSATNGTAAQSQQAAAAAEAQTMLALHNEKRALHQNTPPMQWDATTAEHAQRYVDTCPSGHSSSDTSYRAANTGENIAYSTSTTYEASGAVAGWYDEIRFWSFATNRGSGGVTGHFTQMVWDDSVLLGCGVKHDC